MADHSLHIVIGGEAGQGLVTVGQLLAKGLVRQGYCLLVNQDYQSRIRGGHNTFRIRTGIKEILAPIETIDLLIALDQQTLSIHQPEMGPGGLIVLDSDFKGQVPAGMKVPFKELGSGRVANVLALGVAGALLGLSETVLAQAVDDFFGRKKASLLEENRRALEAAFQWTRRQPVSFSPLDPVRPSFSRLMMNGNEAIALGALSAGLRFLSFYPMTPSTSIALTLTAQAEKMGLLVEQAEDEIAAVNMAIGASYAGAPSMVCTSGGGFALMVEGISLAGMTETPLVVVLGQRPGPATGLPTRTEQSDLDFIIHAGHGEFPRAVFAPGTIEECFHLTRQAFELAEAFQTPVFLLTDQYLADSYRAVKPFELAGLPSFGPTLDSALIGLPYRRYALTPTGVSPRLLPGQGPHLVVADSDEHTEDGHLTEDLLVRRQMVEKRLRKGEGIRREVRPPEFIGDENPGILFLTWGSTRGAVLEAASILRERGKRLGALHFSQPWPLIPQHFLERLEKADTVIAVEGNATGQLARLIRRESGFAINQTILRYDGLPITANYILDRLGQSA